MFRKLCIAVAVLASFASISNAQDRSILVQSTTSTQNSGFYDYILPIFTDETGITVNIVAVGTGQAIKNAENGDADVLLVHAKEAEEAFVASGNGVERFDLMYNDFVILGPEDDPLDLKGADSVAKMLRILSTGDGIFVSRGDDSGTHKKELSLWGSMGFTPEISSGWYRETGSGMGSTIRVAVEMQAYTMSDRATWIAYENKVDEVIVFEGEPPLFNQYGIIMVNPDKHPHVNVADAQIFIDWMLSDHGQDLINSYYVNGQQLFFANAAPI